MAHSGLATAHNLLTKLLKPLVKKWRRDGKAISRILRKRNVGSVPDLNVPGLTLLFL